MIIPEKFIPFFINELHRHQQYQVLTEKVQNWDAIKISQENIRSNLLSLFQYRMFSDPGFYQHVLEEIQNDETVFQNTTNYLKYLWYSWTVDPISYCHVIQENNQEFDGRLEEICCKELCPKSGAQLASYLYKYPMHSILNGSFIMELRNHLKNEDRGAWELIYLQLTRNRSPYSSIGNIAYLATKGKKDPKLWKKLVLEWLIYFSKEITFEKSLYPKLSDDVDNQEVLNSNEKFVETDRYFLSFNSNRESEAQVLFSNTDYCKDLRKKFAKEFHIDYKPYWQFNAPNLEDYLTPEEYKCEEFLLDVKEKSRPYVTFQKFTSDCISIAAEFWFLSKTEKEMCSLLNQEWKFSIEHMLDSFDNLPLSEISNRGLSYFNYGCVDEALTIFEYYLSHAKSPEEKFDGHFYLGECNRLLKQYDVAYSHYSHAKDLIAPFLGTMNWDGLNEKFKSPEAYGRLAEIHIREMNHILKKKDLQINPKKILKNHQISFNEKNELAEKIFEIYSRVGLGRKGHEKLNEWSLYSLNDHVDYLNLPKEEAEQFRKKQTDYVKMGKLVNTPIEDDYKESIWEDRDQWKKKYQDFIKICGESFQTSLNSKYCEKLSNLRKFYHEDITITRQLKLNSNVEIIYQYEQEFYLQFIYKYAVSLYKIGNYELCSNLTEEYLGLCKEIQYWNYKSQFTDEEVQNSFEYLINYDKNKKNIDSFADLHAEMIKLENSPYQEALKFLKYGDTLGLWGISAYAMCSLIMNGKMEEGMQVCSDELKRLSKIDHNWELSKRFSHFIDTIFENADSFDPDVRNTAIDGLENAVLEHFPDYHGINLISQTYLDHYWLIEAENWFKGKKLDRNIADLSLDDKGRIYKIKGRFYLKRGSMFAEKMFHKAEESPVMSQPGREMMFLQLDLANFALLKKDFSGMKECYMKILNSGYEPDNSDLKEKMDEIQNYLNRHLTLDKLSSNKLSDVVNYFEKAELESIQFYNLGDSKSSQEEKIDCSIPLSHYAWGLDKYLYLILWIKVRDYVSSKNIDYSEYNDLKYSKEVSLNSWYPPFGRNSYGKSKDNSPTLGNWMHLNIILNSNSPNQVIMHMSDFLQKLEQKLLDNIVEIAGILQPYRNDICHAKPVYMTSEKFQEERSKIVSSLNELFDQMSTIKI